MSKDVMGFWESLGLMVVQWIMSQLGLYKVELNYEERTVTTTSEYVRVHGIELDQG